MSSNAHVRHVWTIGSYADVGPNFLAMAARLVESAGVESDQRVLDVACGTRNVAITAARRGAAVTGVDITPAMLADARENAAIAGVDGVDGVEWKEGDATDLPFEDDAFDISLSCVGHMFANPPEAAAAELLRVTEPGGTIAFTAWTPQSVVPATATVMGNYLAADPDAPDPPFLWGDAKTVRERLGDGVTEIAFETGVVEHMSLSPAHFWEGARTHSGLFIDALEGVNDDEYPSLRKDMLEVVEGYFDDGTNAVQMDYLLTSATIA